jgi:hypothetical protein
MASSREGVPGKLGREWDMRIKEIFGLGSDRAKSGYSEGWGSWGGGHGWGGWGGGHDWGGWGGHHGGWGGWGGWGHHGGRGC